MKIVKIIIYPVKLIFLCPVYFYKFCISPLLPSTCRFSPTCSSYMVASIKEFGPFKGSLVGFKRICRCTPNNKCYGYDPVPINIKGESKWLF